ncbi:hypothetical protein PT974_06774 [Cladobotryum mycophilum]|uniref:Uncharacterized protein n=1 Tax=Cladobotryum mycophilum TaxID=491253 RepID=A0ABR0SNJ5_9HYPO
MASTGSYVADGEYVRRASILVQSLGLVNIEPSHILFIKLISEQTQTKGSK